MQEWFYVKNDLSQREDVKEIIQRPIWSRFSIRRPHTALGNDVQACQAAFNIVCTYIGIRDLVQEHIVYRVWPLASGWEMPKKVATGSSQGGLVYLKYTFRYRSQFDEPNDGWLDAIEATSDELLGAYSKAEDEAMTIAFDAQGKKRLNRAFDAIGFVYPDYCFPVRKQGRKRKIAASASSSASKAKKVKVLTRRPRRIKTANVPKLIEGVEIALSAIELGPIMPLKTHTDPGEESKSEKAAEQLKVLSLATTTELPKPSSVSAATLRKRRMASVLDAILESTKMSAPAFAEASSEKTKDAKEDVAASAAIAPTEAGPIELVEESAPKGSKHHAPEPPHKELEFIIRHASGKQLSTEQIAEVEHYAKDLKYPRGSLVYRGDDEEDFLYCLPDNKEINVCHEMMNNMGFPKLELGLSAMSKDQLADSLAFNSLKVCNFWLRVLVLSELFFSSSYIYCLLFCFILQGLILSKALKAQKDAEDKWHLGIFDRRL
jgi:hypothetical protein